MAPASAPAFPQQDRKSLADRWHYQRRIFSAYLRGRRSHLSFWHDTPEINGAFRPAELGEYYMRFTEKADYSGPFDSAGVPLLDYHGRIGRQYNPIAIAQYGLANFNLFSSSSDAARRSRMLAAADWLLANLEQNRRGLWVWNHHFDWDYRTRLVAPWYSGLAQGQGISLLVRVHCATGDSRYLEAAHRAFAALSKTTAEGGVLSYDDAGNVWIEEYIVSPPTHILNGFLWAAWGVYDYSLATASREAAKLFDDSVRTLVRNLARFDTGYWSLYEQSGTRLRMLASPFYHRLHIVQLRIMHRLTGEAEFADRAARWEAYQRSGFKRRRAVVQKAIFKLLYY